MNKSGKEELENKIEILNERITSLHLIMQDFKCPNAKEVIRLQIDNYSDSIKLLKKEMGHQDSPPNPGQPR